MKGWLLLSCLCLVAAQSPTCNDVRSVLATRECCQLAADEPSVEEFVWRSCTLTAETDCQPGDHLVRTSRPRSSGEGAHWECSSSSNGRRLNDQYDQQLEELRYRVLKLEDELRLYKE